ncbi:MAG: hypothetical protein DHS80DRAFT_25389 [Piptocephalis tieghemiana]|nr:MAG: hypothetical protein DHS80DRAFT_25389 [Piptocephalis tieghemiana]
MFGTSKRFPEKKGSKRPQQGSMNYESKVSRSDPKKQYKFMGTSDRFKGRSGDDALLLPPPFSPPALSAIIISPSNENTQGFRKSKPASSIRKPPFSTVGASKMEYLELEKEVKRLKDRIAKDALEHETSLAEVRGRLGRVKAELVSVNQEKSALETQYAKMGGDLKEAHRRMTLLKSRVEEGKRTGEEASVSSKNHLKRIRDLENDIKGMHDKMDVLEWEKAELSRKDKENMDALDQLNRTKELLGKEQERSAYLEGRVRQLSKESMRLQESFDSLQEAEKHQNLATEEEAAAYLSQVHQLQDALGTISQEKDRIKDEFKERERELNEELEHLQSLLRTQHEKHKAQMEALKRQLPASSSSSTMDREGKRTEMEMRSREMSWEKRDEERTQEISMLRGLVQVLEQDQTRLTQVLQERTKETEEASKVAKEQIATCQEEAKMTTNLLELRVSMAMEEARRLRAELEAVSAEVKGLREKSDKDRINSLLDRERLMRDHAATVASLERAAAEVAQRIRQSAPDRTGRVKELEREVVRCKGEMEWLRAQLKEQKESSTGIQDQSKGFTRDYERGKRQRTDEMDHVGHTQAQVEALHQELEQLRTTSQAKLIQQQELNEKLKDDLNRMTKEHSGLKDLLREQAEERAEAQEQLELQTEFIRSRHPSVADELSRASDGVLANSNTRLRIKNLNRLKDDLLSMKEENASLIRQVEEEQKRADRTEAELMAFKAIGPTTTLEAPKGRRQRMHKVGVQRPT